jgi:starch-binding outer membrane protein, SusD/RagB family
MKKSLKLVSVAAFTMALACSPEALDKRNPNQLTPDNYFKNAAELTTATNSIYALLQGNSLVGREWFFLQHLRSDDFASGGGQLETPRNQILTGVHDPANFVLNEVWNGLYRAILRTNTVIDLAPKATDANSPAVKRLIAEAKYLRGWCYYELVTLWGGVPIYKAVAASRTGTEPRAKEDDVYALIIDDLKAAQTDLPASYSGTELGRVTKGAAQMLLARTYMHRGDYTNAKTELQKFMPATPAGSGTYELMQDYNDNFREEKEWNKESIFEIGYTSIGDINWAGDGNDPSWGQQEKMVRTQEYSVIGWRNLIPSQSLINEFESTSKGDAKTDPRRAMSFYVVGDKYNNGASTLTDGQIQGNTSTFEGAVTKVSWQKYSILYKSDPGGYGNSGINYRVTRYAEAVLMMAECENELGNGAAAIGWMNLIRNRPGVQMPPYPTAKYPCSNKNEIFAALIHEKRVELNGEEVRNRDILRWRKLNKLTSEPIAYFQKNKHELLPIPQAEIDNNDKIEQKDQNPGY